MDPILEGLVTTTDPNGRLHFAPMGPRVSPDGKRLLLRPFPTSNTFKNLKAHGEGVLHVTDDVLLLAKAAMGEAALPAHRPAERIGGFVLVDACRYSEFVVRSIDESNERVQIVAEVVHTGVLREFFGFNRAKHAVLEAAIMSTRLHLLDGSEVALEFEKWRVVVEKTGGPAEREAFEYLRGHLRRSMEKGETR